MRKAGSQENASALAGSGRVLARVLAEDLRNVRATGMGGQPSIQATGTLTDVDSWPDYTWRGSDGDSV